MSDEAPGVRLTAGSAVSVRKSDEIELKNLPEPLQSALKSLDVNLDGQLNAVEIARAVELLKYERSRSRQVWCLLYVAVTFTLLVSASNLATSMVAEIAMRTLDVREQAPAMVAARRALSADGHWNALASDAQMVGTLVSRAGHVVATAATHTERDLKDDLDASALSFVQRVKLEMDDGAKHVLRVAGYTWHNATDIDFFTDVHRL